MQRAHVNGSWTAAAAPAGAALHCLAAAPAAVQDPDPQLLLLLLQLAAAAAAVEEDHWTLWLWQHPGNKSLHTICMSLESLLHAYACR